MEKSKQLPFSGKLSDDTIIDMDEDELMERIRLIIKKKEKLKSEVEHKTMESDFWQEVLSCSTTTELESLFISNPALPFATPLTSPQHTILGQYHGLTSHIQGLRFMEGVSAHQTQEGGLLLRFHQPPSSGQYQAYLVILIPSQHGSYSVQHHNMPSTVPLAKFEKEHLKREEKEEEEEHVGLRRFVTCLYQYVRPLYSRQTQICTLQEILPIIDVYHNQSCTLINFATLIKLKDSNSIHFELVLEYDPCDILPMKVTYKSIGDCTLPQDLLEILDDLCRDLKKDPFPQVLLNTFGGDVSGQDGDAEKVDDTGDDDSDDDIFFDT